MKEMLCFAHLGDMSELAYMPLPAGGNSVSEWIHLLPAEAGTIAINNALGGAKSDLSLHSKTVALAGLGANASGDEIVADKATLDAVAVVDQSDDWSRYQSRPQCHPRGGSIL